MKSTRFVSVQNKLALLFTVLFLVGAVTLAGFLRLSAMAMTYDLRARAAYEQIRQLYLAQVYLQRLERAVVNYQLTGDFDALTEYYSTHASLQQTLAGAGGTVAVPDEQAAFERLGHDVAALRQRFDPVFEAVDQEDWSRVTALNEEASGLVDSVSAQIGSQIEARNPGLLALRDEGVLFSTLAWLAIALAAPLFLAMIAVVVVIVARQINVPIIRMADALDQVRDGRFDASILAPLPERRDEIGYLAREYVRMAGAVLNRRTALEQAAQEVRARIR